MTELTDSQSVYEDEQVRLEKLEIVLERGILQLQELHELTCSLADVTKILGENVSERVPKLYPVLHQLNDIVDYFKEQYQSNVKQH